MPPSLRRAIDHGVAKPLATTTGRFTCSGEFGLGLSGSEQEDKTASVPAPAKSRKDRRTTPAGTPGCTAVMVRA
ncbi:hypothetical protein GCM10009628_34220 [Paeniglutamicibacter kerguelensis]